MVFLFCSFKIKDESLENPVKNNNKLFSKFDVVSLLIFKFFILTNPFFLIENSEIPP